MNLRVFYIFVKFTGVLIFVSQKIPGWVFPKMVAGFTAPMMRPLTKELPCPRSLRP